MILFIIHYNSKIASIMLTMIQLSACFDQKDRTDKTYISTVRFIDLIVCRTVACSPFCRDSEKATQHRKAAVWARPAIVDVYDSW